MSLIDSAADPELLLVLVTVAGILVLQTLIAIAYLAYRNYKEKAKWRRLSQQGIVTVHGPALYWTDDLPMPSVPVTVNMTRLGQTPREPSRIRIADQRRYSPGQKQDVTCEG